jgi:hypothetical protein
MQAVSLVAVTVTWDRQSLTLPSDRRCTARQPLSGLNAHVLGEQGASGGVDIWIRSSDEIWLAPSRR